MSLWGCFKIPIIEQEMIGERLTSPLSTGHKAKNGFIFIFPFNILKMNLKEELTMIMNFLMECMFIHILKTKHLYARNA